jgi:hypothetical protein
MVSKTMRALLEAAQMQKVVVNGCRNFSATGEHNRLTHNLKVVSPNRSLLKTVHWTVFPARAGRSSHRNQEHKTLLSSGVFAFEGYSLENNVATA